MQSHSSRHTACYPAAVRAYMHKRFGYIQADTIDPIHTHIYRCVWVLVQVAASVKALLLYVLNDILHEGLRAYRIIYF